MFTEQHVKVLKELADSSRHVASSLDRISMVTPPINASVISLMENIRQMLLMQEKALNKIQMDIELQNLG